MANLEAYGEKVVGLTGSVVSWTQSQTTGTKIAEIDIDGTTTDVYAPSGGSVNYSTTEQVIGTWIDGKPLYEKTYNFGALPNNTTKTLAHGITALDTVADFKGIAHNPVSHVRIPLPYNQIPCGVANANITVTTYSNLSAYTETYITLRYTKTTD